MTVRYTRRCLLSLLGMFYLLASFSIHAEDNILVEFVNGETRSGRVLSDFNDPRKAPRLDGKTIELDGKNPVRLIQQRNIVIDYTGPFVQFHNGDVLKMTPVNQHTVKHPQRSLVVFNYERQQSGIYNTHAILRGSHVRRIVITPAMGPTRYTPGLVVLKNGQRIQSLAISFENNQLQVLDDERIRAYPWDEVAQANAPITNTWKVQARKIMNLNTRVARATLADGSRVTYPRGYRMEERIRTRRGSQYYHLVQPFWSHGLLRYAINDVAIWSFHAPNEIPLSALPVKTIIESSPTGAHWPWVTDRSVTGTTLSSGNAVSDLGFGVHASSEIEITLPRNTERLYTRVGLNHEVGMGGYAKAIIYDPAQVKNRAEVILAGSEKVHRMELKNLSKSKHIRFMVDPLLDGGPNHADPLDIRDHVDWIGPTLVLKPSAITGTLTNQDINKMAPALRAWQRQIKPEQYKLAWAGHSKSRSWSLRYLTDEKNPIVFERDFQVTPHLTEFVFQVARANRGDKFWVDLLISVEDQEVMKKTYDLSRRREWDAETILFSLAEHMGKNARIVIKMRGDKKKMTDTQGIVIYSLVLQSWLRDQAGSGKAIKPDLKLSSIKDLQFRHRDNKRKTKDNMLGDKRTYRLGTRTFKEGFFLDNDHSVTFKVPEGVTQLVMVASGGSDKNTRLLFKVDDQVLHTETEINRFKRPTQIVLDVKPGQTITVESTDSYVSLLYPGFKN